MLRPAVFLDRDGTLMEEVHYCADPALVRVFPGTASALRRLAERGYLCVIITNQSGIGRGLLTEAQYHAVQAELLRQLETQEEGENLELRNSGGERSGNQETRKENEMEFRGQVRYPLQGSAKSASREMSRDAAGQSQMEFGNEKKTLLFSHEGTKARRHEGSEQNAFLDFLRAFVPSCLRVKIRKSGGERETGPEEIGEPEGFQANSRGSSEATPPEPSQQASHPGGVTDSRPCLIAASCFCPDAPPTPSPRRKPEPGMVLEAARDLGIDLARSWFVGDKAADIACGAHAGTRTILVLTGYGTQTATGPGHPAPNFIAKDIVAAVEVVLQNSDAIRP